MFSTEGTLLQSDNARYLEVPAPIRLKLHKTQRVVIFQCDHPFNEYLYRSYGSTGEVQVLHRQDENSNVGYVMIP